LPPHSPLTAAFHGKFLGISNEHRMFDQPIEVVVVGLGHSIAVFIASITLSVTNAKLSK
jgi:hypothetical protein